MSVTIRMQRAGGRNAPFYRVVVADSRRARDGRFLEKVGYYNPLSQPAQVHLDQERVRFWVENGGQPSESVDVLWKKIGGNAAEATSPRAAPAPMETRGHSGDPAGSADGPSRREPPEELTLGGAGCPAEPASSRDRAG